MSIPDDSGCSAAMPLALLVARIRPQEARLAEELTRRFEAEIPFLRSGAVTRSDLVASAAHNLRAALRALGDWPARPRTWPSDKPRLRFAGTPDDSKDFDESQPSDTGVRWARMGVPLADVTAHYRVGARFVWETLVQAASDVGVPREHLVETASAVFLLQDRAIESMTSSYRAELTAIANRHDAERSAHVEALLEGHATATATVWEIAELLRLPPEGSYVVVAADVTGAAPGSADDDAQRLRSAGFASAWLLLPSRRIGIVNLPRGRASVGSLVDALRRISPNRQGLSPVYDDLVHTATATRLARVALLGTTSDDRHRVLPFDDAPLPITSVAAPEINRHVAESVLAGLAGLATGQREMLIDTLRTWMDSSGSATVTARHLHVHRNTVRQRMARIERLTNRSMSNPRHVSELCVALETNQRLM